jgi:hypothetical protein
LEDFDTEVKINSTWENIKESIKVSATEGLCYYELEQHKLWFDEKRSVLLGQRKQAKLERLQDSSEINGDGPNNVRRETSRHFRNSKEGASERQN